MTMPPPPLLIFFFISTFLLSNPPPSSAQTQQPNTSSSSFSISSSPWRPRQNHTLLSPNSLFSAGFLPLPTSPYYTFSIRHHNISIWSANVDFPVNASATLAITSSGDLRLGYSAGRNLWRSPPTPQPNNTHLVLNDDGSLVFGNWSSFDFPTNTILPNQPINGTTLSSDNGKFSLINSTGLFFNKTDPYWVSDNLLLNFDQFGRLYQTNGATFISSDYGDVSRSRRLTLDDDGNLRLYSFDRRINQWVPVWQAVFEICTIHGSCGPNYICVSDDSNHPSCVCPPGFRRNAAEKQHTCERKIPITNPSNTKFLRLDFVNFTGGSNQSNVKAQNLTTCQAKCSADPNCVGFMYRYQGTGYCVLQLERLLHGYWSPGTESAMFLRVDRSETDRSNFTGLTEVMETSCPVRFRLPLPPEDSNTTTRNIVIISTLFAAELVTGVMFFWAFLKKYIKYRDMAQTLGLELLPAGGPKRFSYAELKAATNNFSNVIGKGGFSDVYRGELSDHRVVAVKCLKNVAGGDTEFWAEVTIIARMHHLNLVRLWGFCAEKGQRILVYEYVPNGSLDKFLFRSGRANSADPDSEPKPLLDWNIRYRIALGVARAIAYLHEECLEWVLHCDIKPENILLGDDFCPKVSDFGLAKLRKKEDIISMSRIRGTPGYVAPEWVKTDAITSKADVYSFGMVLLELVSGVRNFEIQSSKLESSEWYFPRWAFDKVFKEMNVEDILDIEIKNTYESRVHFGMIDRMVKTAMWCLQHRPDERPSMGKVAKMLEGSVEITEPKKPTIFYLGDE